MKYKIENNKTSCKTRNDADAPDRLIDGSEPFHAVRAPVLQQLWGDIAYAWFNALCSSSSSDGEIAGSIGVVLAALTRSCDSGAGSRFGKLKKWSFQRLSFCDLSVTKMPSASATGEICVVRQYGDGESCRTRASAVHTVELFRPRGQYYRPTAACREERFPWIRHKEPSTPTH